MLQVEIIAFYVIQSWFSILVATLVIIKFNVKTGWFHADLLTILQFIQVIVKFRLEDRMRKIETEMIKVTERIKM